MFKLFLFAYIQLLLLAVLHRAVNRQQYVGVFIVALIVGVTHFTIFRTMMDSADVWSIVGYALGGALGNVSGTWLHHRFSKKEIKK